MISPLVYLYTFLAISIVLLKNQLVGHGIDVRVLHGANTLLFIVASLTTFWMAIALRRSGGQALLKALYGGFIIRFFLIAVTAFIYILSKRKQVNIPGLIGGALFYILYLVVEIRSTRKSLKSESSYA